MLFQDLVIHFQGSLVILLINKVIRPDVGHVLRGVRIVSQHLLREFLERLIRGGSTDLIESETAILHHSREQILV